MDIPEGIETGYAGGEQFEWCARLAGAKTTLCGRKVNYAGRRGWFSAEGPSDPERAHPECLRLLAEAAS